MKKYNIENFYIGELCLSREFGNLLVRTALSEEEKSQIEIRLITKCNGAIEINNYIDWSARRNYVSLFTLFYKENEQYICLHNNNVYSTNGFDHCQNLIPLSTVLPKVSSTIPNELSINFVLDLFNNLFNSKVKFDFNKLYTKEKYDINDFYLGYLTLYTSYYSYQNERRKYNLHNLSQELILDKSDAKLLSLTGNNDILNDIAVGTYDYCTYKSIFLKLPNNNLYNLHSFGEYNIGTMENKPFTKKEEGISYYDRIIPFSLILEKNNIKIPSKINIQKTLKLYNKINK